MLKQHYDYSTSNRADFSPTKESEDSSKSMNTTGFPNVYSVVEEEKAN
jgi:hypothetical protein